MSQQYNFHDKVNHWYHVCFTWMAVEGNRVHAKVVLDGTALIDKTVEANPDARAVVVDGLSRSIHFYQDQRGFGGLVTNLNLWHKHLGHKEMVEFTSRCNSHLNKSGSKQISCPTINADI